MKQIYFLLAVMLGFTFQVNAQNTVEVDANATQLGFMNVFELPANGGGFAFGSAWGVPDLKSVVDGGAGTITLQPNFNTYADNPTDPFWVDQTTLEGNKQMVASTYEEDDTLIGAELTFVGSCPSYTLDGAYTAQAFIRVFNADFSVLKEELVPLVEGQTFAVNYTNVEGTDAHVQFGFVVEGPNANPADEAALGSVVVGPTILSTEDVSVSQVSVYPNPSSDRWNITTVDQNINTVEVFDLAGKRVESIKPDSRQASINAGSLTAGIYFARVITAQGETTLKLIKK